MGRERTVDDDWPDRPQQGAVREPGRRRAPPAQVLAVLGSVFALGWLVGWWVHGGGEPWGQLRKELRRLEDDAKSRDEKLERALDDVRASLDRLQEAADDVGRAPAR